MLKLDSVRVNVGGFLVLRDVTLSLERGQSTLLVGRNGAGKTTTLRTLMGLLPLQAGSMYMDTTDLTAVPAHGRAALGIGYAPEDRRLIGDFNVEENLLLPALAVQLSRQERHERLEEIYGLLPELRQLRTRPGGSLSGGQGKMVALGRALMVGTRYILLDEPFQGLAPALAKNYARTLARLREQRNDIGILITESSPQYLQDIVDHTLHIERGEIAADEVVA